MSEEKPLTVATSLTARAQQVAQQVDQVDQQVATTCSAVMRYFAKILIGCTGWLATRPFQMDPADVERRVCGGRIIDVDLRGLRFANDSTHPLLSPNFLALLADKPSHHCKPPGEQVRRCALETLSGPK